MCAIGRFIRDYWRLMRGKLFSEPEHPVTCKCETCRAWGA